MTSKHQATRVIIDVDSGFVYEQGDGSKCKQLIADLGGYAKLEHCHRAANLAVG